MEFKLTMLADKDLFDEEEESGRPRFPLAAVLRDQPKMTSVKFWDFLHCRLLSQIGIITFTQLIRTVFCFWDNTLSLNADVHYGRSLTMGSPLHSRDGGR